MTDQEKRAFLIGRLLMLWERYPELRFCQLVADVNYGSSTNSFYVEDDLFIERMELFQKQNPR